MGSGPFGRLSMCLIQRRTSAKCASQTYLGIVDDAIAGFYTPAAGQVTHEEAPARLTKGLANHWILSRPQVRPVVERHRHGEGAGKALLREAEQRTLQVADLAAIRALNPAFADSRFPPASFSAKATHVVLNGNELCPVEIWPPSALSFRPAGGWRGRSELAEKEEACRVR